jgi:hypothetical protein
LINDAEELEVDLRNALEGPKDPFRKRLGEDGNKERKQATQ